MRYAVADTTNGITNSFEDYDVAMFFYRELTREGFSREIEIQEETGLTDQQIREKVGSFYQFLIL